MSYTPGLHILAEMITEEQYLLEEYSSLKKHLNELVKSYELTEVGQVFHNFQPAGFTGVLCLTESHISIHTWPENHLLTLDIYLSNYQKQNDQKAREIFENLKLFFRAKSYKVQEIRR
ncbi:MAG: adenosylmethionine decarboxylase [Sporocytophaga sp.]|jgi:S-adenosylmethionine decarboxylase|nr:adenosylmethionine decarboxylase [Sporocytophaga sp.]